LEIIRNLLRRKLRSILTITGIVMGILALTTMGALAEHFNSLLDGGVKYFGGNINVGDDRSGSGGFGGGLLEITKVSEIEAVDGVAAAAPSISVNAKPGDFGGFGGGDSITSFDPNFNRYSAFKTEIGSGHGVNNDSRGDVVLGSTMAAEFKVKVGDTIDLPKKPKDAKADFVTHTYNVVGITKPTLTAPDNFATVSLHDAQQLFGEQLSPAIRSQVDPFKLSSSIVVYGKSGVDLDKLADRITAEVPGVKATKPSVLVNAFKSFGATFTFITTAAALLALVIGGISVVNTMIMAVTERYREIGLKKAVGARTGHILREFLAESTVIGLIGGVLGYAFGYAITFVLNLQSAPNGIFLVTPRLTALALLFAVGLGAVAGIIPAFRAARLDPVTALRAQ
jgi:putative ABC transport system permease protein